MKMRPDEDTKPPLPDEEDDGVGAEEFSALPSAKRHKISSAAMLDMVLAESDFVMVDK